MCAVRDPGPSVAGRRAEHQAHRQRQRHQAGQHVPVGALDVGTVEAVAQGFAVDQGLQDSGEGLRPLPDAPDRSTAAGMSGRPMICRISQAGTMPPTANAIGSREKGTDHRPAERRRRGTPFSRKVVSPGGSPAAAVRARHRRQSIAEVRCRIACQRPGDSIVGDRAASAAAASMIPCAVRSANRPPSWRQVAARAWARIERQHGFDGTRQAGDVAEREDRAGPPFLDQVGTAADRVGDDSRHAAGHRLVDDQPPGLDGRQDDHVGGSIDRRQLALIDEAMERRADTGVCRGLLEARPPLRPRPRTPLRPGLRDPG